MLYITTQNHKDFHTAYHALSSDECHVGRLYIPFQFAKFTPDEIDALKEKSFSQCVADILNIFFSARLDAWDVACCMGTHPLKLVPMSHKITVAEVWNNPEWNLSRFVRNLNGRLLGNTDSGLPSNWAEIAVRIAVLFGIYAKLCRIGIADSKRTVDISVVSGDFATPMAAWYARNMGLPVGSIIFSCNNNSAAWDLLHHGELQTDISVIATSTPLCDVGIPVNMERLICATLGFDEARVFANHCASKSVYTLTEEARQILSAGIFGAVVSENRVQSIIRNVYSTKAYILSPYSALAYGGLQDYRATSSESGQALILTEVGPLCEPDFIACAIGVTAESLRDRLSGGR